MRSRIVDIMPPIVSRSLTKFGGDIALARKKRALTIQMMAERLGVAKTTYLRVEQGDPTVTIGIYAMALFVLGFGDAFGELIDARRDEQGMLFEIQRLPQRVRIKKKPQPL